jgi:phosphoglycerate dehydrogenase-like enzyme
LSIGPAFRKSHITVFNDHVSDPVALVERLKPFTECALVAALNNHKIAGAALDVYDIEPLPLDHPFRSIENAITTPHIDYVTRGIYETFYGDTVENILAWLDGQPIRVME